MSTLSKRVDEAWKALPRDKWGNPPKLRPLEQEHDIADGALGRLVSGERQHANDVTLPKVAAALQVSIDWLCTGKGPGPGSGGYGAMSNDTPLDNRHAAMAFARACGVSASVLERVKRLRDPGYSAREWLALIDAEELRERSARK